MKDTTVKQAPRAVLDVVASMTTLADWYATHKPSCKVMTLTRRDFDLLRKHAGVSGVTENNGTTFWRGFELHVQGGMPRINARE